MVLVLLLGPVRTGRCALDWKFLFAALSFLVGALAGFQGIHSRFKKDSISASRTLFGFLYLLSRGAIPAAIFVFVYGSGLIERYLILWALTCGVSAETVLRSKFYIKETDKDGGSIDLIKGPFDLLQWYQNFVLEEAATSLAGTRKRFVKRTLPKGPSFLVLCDRVINNLSAYPPDQAITIEVVRTHVETLRNNFNEVNSTTNPDARTALNQQFSEQLGYAVLNAAGKRGFQTLLVEAEAVEVGVENVADS